MDMARVDIVIRFHSTGFVEVLEDSQPRAITIGGLKVLGVFQSAYITRRSTLAYVAAVLAGRLGVDLGERGNPK